LATYHAIAAISLAIKKLLESGLQKPEFEGAQLAIYQASDFQTPMKEGVSLYLYRLGAGSRRNLPAQTGPQGQVYRPPIPLDLYYLLNAWAADAVKQQRLLGWCVRELGDTPVLPSALLNSVGPEHEVFGPDESVELIFDPLSLQDLANLWEPLKPNLMASATYVARMVALNSTVEAPAAGPVQTREFNFNQVGRQ